MGTIHRSLLLSGVAVAALCSGAQAADLIVDIPVDEPVAVEETGWYVSVFAGGAWPGFAEAEDEEGDEFDIETDMGWLAGVAAGARVMDMLRVEIELSHLQQDVSSYSENDGPDIAVEDGSISSTYLLGNVWFDFDTGSGFTPYLGGGVGLGHVSAEGDPLGDDVYEGIALAYQLGAGVDIAVTDNISVDLGYRWKSIVGAETEDDDGDQASGALGNHTFQAGLRFGL